MTTRSDDAPSLSRRDFFKHAGATSLTAALCPLPTLATDAPAPADGTPEQIHLTFGDDPTTTVIVSCKRCPGA